MTESAKLADEIERAVDSRIPRGRALFLEHDEWLKVAAALRTLPAAPEAISVEAVAANETLANELRMLVTYAYMPMRVREALAKAEEALRSVSPLDAFITKYGASETEHARRKEIARLFAGHHNESSYPYCEEHEAFAFADALLALLASVRTGPAQQVQNPHRLPAGDENPQDVTALVEAADYLIDRLNTVAFAVTPVRDLDEARAAWKAAKARALLPGG